MRAAKHQQLPSAHHDLPSALARSFPLCLFLVQFLHVTELGLLCKAGPRAQVIIPHRSAAPLSCLLLLLLPLCPHLRPSPTRFLPPFPCPCRCGLPHASPPPPLPKHNAVICRVKQTQREPRCEGETFKRSTRHVKPSDEELHL